MKYTFQKFLALFLALISSGTLLTLATVQVSAATVSASVTSTADAGISVTASGTPRGGGRRLGARIGSSTTASSTASIADIQSRANTQIDERVTALNKLLTRVQGLKKISTSDQSNLVSQIQAQIGVMTNLKAKIDADTDVTTLRTDVQSIAKAYRVYLLVIPQGAIEAEADRIENITGMMTTIGTKLQSRITAAAATGQNTTTVQASLTDYNSKIADAATQAQAAVTEISSLTPDQGVQATLTANTAALKDARTKLMAATKDLQAARSDASSIVKAIESWHINTTATSTTSTTASTTQ